MDEIGKLLLALVMLLVLVGAFFLFKEKGGDILVGIKNLLRFGR